VNKSEFLGLKLPSRDNTTDIADINAISDNFETIDSVFLDLVEKQIPEFQTKENMNLNFDDNSTNEEQYPSVPAVVNFANRKVDPLKIINSASGNAIALKDSAKDKLNGLKLFGKTTQNGTPTPDNPIELKSIGDSGSYEVGVYGRNILNLDEMLNAFLTKNSDGTYTMTKTNNNTGRFSAFQNVFIPANSPLWFSVESVNYTGTTNFWFCLQFLASDNSTIDVSQNGIGKKIILDKDIVSVRTYLLAVDADGTISTIKNAQLVIGETATPYEPCTKQTLTMPYTLRGVGDIKDEVDFNRGVLIQRIHSINIESTNGVSFYAYMNTTRIFVSAPKALASGVGMCNSLAVSSYPTNANDVDNHISGWINGGVYFRCDELANATDKDAWLTEHPIYFIYPLAEPIETPLTEAELNAYRQLHTNKPNTTILSEADMEVSYVADTKLYIDNKLAELTALALEV
jgi:hypothetical protein